MIGNNDNIQFCDRQVLRFAGTDYWANMTPTAIKELSTALCVSAESQADAEAMVTARLLLDNERPTPAYFGQVAKDRKREAQAQVSWSPPPRTEPEFTGCRICGGTGWEIVFTLTTKEGNGDYTFTKTENITQQVFDSFNGGKLDPQKQSCASGARRCKCGAVPGTQQTSGAPWTKEQLRESEAKFKAFCEANPDFAKGKPKVKKVSISTAGKDLAGDEGDERKEPKRAGDIIAEMFAKKGTV